MIHSSTDIRVKLTADKVVAKGKIPEIVTQLHNGSELLNLWYTTYMNAKDDQGFYRRFAESVKAHLEKNKDIKLNE